MRLRYSRANHSKHKQRAHVKLSNVCTGCTCWKRKPHPPHRGRFQILCNDLHEGLGQHHSPPFCPINASIAIPNGKGEIKQVAAQGQFFFFFKYVFVHLQRGGLLAEELWTLVNPCGRLFTAPHMHNFPDPLQDPLQAGPPGRSSRGWPMQQRLWSTVAEATFACGKAAAICVPTVNATLHDGMIYEMKNKTTENQRVQKQGSRRSLELNRETKLR